MSTFRITTNGMFRNYRSNLSKNNKRLNDTMTDVQTQRKFNTYAEDPASASRAWRLRRSFWRTGDQINNNTYVISKYESATAAMHAIVDGDAEHPGLDGILSSIEGVSDTSGSARVALGRQLISTSESIVSMMNSKYGDDFIFAGADGANIPFRWEGDRLFYRGVNVSLTQPKDYSEFGLTRDDLKGLTGTDLALTEPTAPIEPQKPADFAETAPAKPAIPMKADGVTPLLSQAEYDVLLENPQRAMDYYYFPYQAPDAQASMTDDEKTLYQFAQDAVKYANEKGDYDAKFNEYQGYVKEYDAKKAEYDEAKAQYDQDLTTYNKKLAAINEKLDKAEPGLTLEKLLAEPKEEDFADTADYARAKSRYEGLQSFRAYAAEYEEKYGVAYENGAKEYEKLQTMADEATYLDIGLGLKEDANGDFVTGSAFNSAVSGLSFLGYGEDKNLAVALRELGRILINADPETGDYADPEKDAARASELLDIVHSTVRSSQGAHVQLEADAKYLQSNLQQLETSRSQLNEQITDTEALDPAEAITEMVWAQYCYNAALRIGTNLLSQSLIDYMN